MAIEIERADTMQLAHDLAAAMGLSVEDVVHQAVFERLVGLVGLDRARQVESGTDDPMQSI